MRSWPRTAWIFVCVCVLCPAASTPAFAQSAGPELKQLFPAGAQSGQTVAVTATGGNLKEARYLASHPGITFATEKGELTVTVAEDVPAGLYDVRALTDKGLSAPRRFLVGGLLEVTEAEKNDTPDTAQELTVPGVLWGRFDRAGDVDCYRFSGQAGQQVSIVCQSVSLDQSAEPLLSLIGPNGTELLHSPGHSQEPALHIVLPAAGEYTLIVVERAYRLHNDANAYRLALLTGPRIVAAFPHTLTRGESQAVTLYGYELPGGKPVAETAAGPLQAPLEQIEVTIDAPVAGDADAGGLLSFAGVPLDGFRYQMPETHGQVRFALVDAPVMVEAEATSSQRDTAQMLALPAVVAGRFRTRGDIDWYAFTAKKGDKLRIEVVGERLGCNMDPDITIHDATGKLLATLTDQTAPRGWPARFPLATPDPGEVWTAPGDGEFRLAVRDLFGGSVGGPDRIYLLSIAPQQPGFEAVAVHSDDKAARGLFIAPGGKATLQVAVIRRDGFDGPVTIRAVGLPEGLTAKEVQIAKGKFDGTLTIEAAKNFAPADAEPWFRLQLQAEASIGDETCEQPVRWLSTVRTGNPPRLRPAEGPLLASPTPEPPKAQKPKAEENK